MARCGKNKNELLVLTGAVYAFVAYLTAFTLEVLFIIDLAKKSAAAQGGLATLVTTTTSAAGQDQLHAHHHYQQLGAFEQARLALESMQAHITISCLAISILYFVLFVASLILIIALILRSTFFILIWMCIMTTMYLPEFGLIIYVSVYGWGLGTRNGQTELIFYLFRAALNVIFIFRAHRLFKDWTYEKNFFMLKSRGGSLGGSGAFAGYDSPYFVGDSLTTTINPVFSSSTLNLSRHHLNLPQDHHNHNHYHHHDQIRDITGGSPPADNNNSDHHHYHRPMRSSLYLNQGDQFGGGAAANELGRKYRHSNFNLIDSVTGRKSGFYLPNSPTSNNNNNSKQHSSTKRQDSVLSIDDTDDYADFEMDLDYRTLTNQRHYAQQAAESSSTPRKPTASNTNNNTSRQPPPTSSVLDSSGSLNRSPATGFSYSTQSLDRRHLRDMDLSIPEHVILRPLGHQPFDYLQRPGSTSNLNSATNLFYK